MNLYNIIQQGAYKNIQDRLIKSIKFSYSNLIKSIFDKNNSIDQKISAAMNFIGASNKIIWNEGCKHYDWLELIPGDAEILFKALLKEYEAIDFNKLNDDSIVGLERLVNITISLINTNVPDYYQMVKSLLIANLENEKPSNIWM